MPVVKLGSVLTEQRLRVEDPDGNGLPLLGVSNKEGVHLSSRERIADVSRYLIVKNNWFAYNPMRINVGSIGYATSQEITGIISPDYVVFSCNKGIYPPYLFMWIKSKEGLLEISRNTAGSVRERLYFKSLANVNIPLPSYKTQRKIYDKSLAVSKIQSSYGLIAEYLSEVRIGILQQAIKGQLLHQNPKDEPASILLNKINEEKERSGQIRKPAIRNAISTINGCDIPYKVPKGWEWVMFGDVLDIQGGTQPPKSTFIYEPQDGYVRLLQIRDLGNKPIPTYVPKNSVRRFCGTEDILIGRYGASVGKIFMGQEGAYNVALAKVCFSRKYILNRYIYFFLKAPQFQKYLSGASRSAQAGFNKKDLFPIPIPIPPFQEQKRIVKRIDKLFLLCDELEEKLLTAQTEPQRFIDIIINTLARTTDHAS